MQERKKGKQRGRLVWSDGPVGVKFNLLLGEACPPLLGWGHVTLCCYFFTLNSSSSPTHNHSINATKSGICVSSLLRKKKRCILSWGIYRWYCIITLLLLLQNNNNNVFGGYCTDYCRWKGALTEEESGRPRPTISDKVRRSAISMALVNFLPFCFLGGCVVWILD